MQSNAHFAPAESAPLTMAIAEVRTVRNTRPVATTTIIAETQSARRGEKWENLAWLLIALASAGVLWLSLSLRG